MSSEPQESAKWYAVLLWPALILILLTSGFGMLHWILKQDLRGFSLHDLEPGYLAKALLCQAATMSIVIFAWFTNLRIHKVEGVGLLQSALMVGVFGLGKYTPGKIWGMVARGMVLYRYVPQQDKVVTMTLIEQAALAHCGVLLGTFAYFANQNNAAGMLFVAALFPLSVYWLSRRGPLALGLISWASRKQLKTALVDAESFHASYTAVFWLFSIMWLFAALVLLYTARTLSPFADLNFAMILFGTVISYVGGFAAFFSIAGLGVREGIMTGVLTPFVGLEVALYTSLLHRLVTIALDISLGVTSVILLKSALRKARQ